MPRKLFSASTLGQHGPARAQKKRERAVSRVLSPGQAAPGDGHFSREPVARLLLVPRHGSGLPGSRTGPDQSGEGLGEPPRCFLLGLAPGGVYLARLVTQPAGELLPHRFTLAWPRVPWGNAEAFGGLFSVALSLALRPVGATHHPVLWSPDFPLSESKPWRAGAPSSAGAPRKRPAGACSPSGHLARSQSLLIYYTHKLPRRLGASGPKSTQAAFSRCRFCPAPIVGRGGSWTKMTRSSLASYHQERSCGLRPAPCARSFRSDARTSADFHNRRAADFRRPKTASRERKLPESKR